MDRQSVLTQINTHLATMEQQGIINERIQMCRELVDRHGRLIFLNLVPQFFHETRESLKKMTTILCQSDVNFYDLDQQAIKLLGSSGCLGACAMYDGCVELRLAIDEKSKERSVLAVSKLRHEYHNLRNQMEVVLQNSTSFAQLVDTQNQSISNQSISCMTTSLPFPNCIKPKLPCFNLKTRRRKPPSHHGGPIDFVAEPIDTRSMSFVGTHEYLSPEIVSGEGHGNAVDWWTLGIFIFELYYGVTPFSGVDNEVTVANIVARGLEFPKEPTISAPLKDLITQLLTKDPTKRMGSTMGASAIKHHELFDDVNWALLRCVSPPFVPDPITSHDFVVKRKSYDESVEHF